MPTLDTARAAYRFFRARYQSGMTFTVAELEAETGWSGQTAPTYIRKKWSDFLDYNRNADVYRVKTEFRRLSEQEFLDHFSQKTPIFGKYKRTSFSSMLTYEFLLPLAREPELRTILDELFYADSIENRVREVGLDEVRTWIQQDDDEDESEYVQKVVHHLADLFSGYSVHHVSGRFRPKELRTHAEAATLLEDYERYLIDETTAAVRFIIPIPSSRSSSFDGGGASVTVDEVVAIRKMFIALFAEAVVRTVKGEDEIWLLEESEHGRSLFVWERDRD
jgi:hypothetical protein